MIGGAATWRSFDESELRAGCDADLVLLQAHDPVEPIRLRATGLAVIRRGKGYRSQSGAAGDVEFAGKAGHDEFSDLSVAEARDSLAEPDSAVSSPF